MTSFNAKSDVVRGAGWRSAVMAHPSPLGGGVSWRWARFIDGLRAKTPPAWPLCIATCGLVFAGHLLYGANSNASALAFATVWLVFGGLTLLLARREDAPAPPILLILAGVCFAGVIATVGSQLLPAGASADPVWRGVEDAAVLSIDRDATIRELIKLLSLAAAFAVGYVVGASDRRARFLAFLVIVASILYAGWAFVQHFTAVGTLFGEQKPYHLDRLTASFLSANNAATVLGMLAVIAAARLARAVKEAASPEAVGASWAENLSRKGGLAVIALLVLVSCIVETQSRFGIAVSAASLVALAAWEVRAASERRAGIHGAALVAFVAAGGLVLLAVFAAGETIERVEATVQDAGSRMAAYEAHWAAFLESPWRGYGLGTFPVLNHLVQTPENHHALAQLNALHNVYLQWLEEAGIVGASLMFGTIGFILLHVWRGLSVRVSMLTWLRAVLLVSVLVLLHSLVDYGLQVPSIAWQWALWLGVGCGLAIPRGQRDEQGAEGKNDLPARRARSSVAPR